MARVLAGKALMAALLYRYAPRITADFARVAERSRSDGVRGSVVALTRLTQRGKLYEPQKPGLLFLLVSYRPLAHAEGGLAVQHELLSQKGCKGCALHRFS